MYSLFNYQRKNIILEVEQLKSNRNEVSKLIGQYKREKKDASELLAQMNGVGEKVKELDEKLRQIDEEIKNLLLITPNVPCGTIAIGKDENDNVEIRKYGEPTHFDFEPKAHWDLVTELDIIDFERAGKITGSRFAVYKGLGARLERALISFMLDLHTGDHGYTEILYKMLCQNTYPGYLYLAEKGCTTLTECWNLGGSHNHVMFSHVSAILYRYIAGIRLKDDAPGMTAFVLAPSLLTDTMECSYDTPHGRLNTEVVWEREGLEQTNSLKLSWTIEYSS